MIFIIEIKTFYMKWYVYLRQKYYIWNDTSRIDMYWIMFNFILYLFEYSYLNIITWKIIFQYLNTDINWIEAIIIERFNSIRTSDSTCGSTTIIILI